MEHIVNVGMDVDTLKQLDNLRRAHPNVPSRVEVIRRLIWDAHAKVVAGSVPRRVIRPENSIKEASPAMAAPFLFAILLY